ncbi:MAG: nucleotide sugar dehydrogenase [Synergistaceae bacterium]|jgi:UDP-N-acetyl-D-galactosamine dehydrogenase|nr:nucleotide sugar dehydrogenase [Synergistaceae bacterium]
MDKIIVVGLGYVGLPLALAFAEKFDDVIGFDTNKFKVENLQRGIDTNKSVDKEVLVLSRLKFTSQENEIRGGRFYIIAVPTPIDIDHIPNLEYVVKATEIVGRVIGRGAIICYESTVYPGVTEDVCVPILSNISGLKSGRDFKVGYSPERINPGDQVNKLETIIKIVSGEDAETRETLKELYASIVKAGIYVTPSIKVAEAAKVVENTQRDLNIALMNELAIIFDRIGINTSDVLKAASTKWNFMPFYPGLVGGHCISIDPYYLTYKSEGMGYVPQVIHAGRKLNEGMGKYVAQKVIKLLCKHGHRKINEAKAGILGLTFKENVPDLRNSKVPDIIKELIEYGIIVLVHDPLVNREEARQVYGLDICDRNHLTDLDVIILTVAHDYYRQEGLDWILDTLKNRDGIFIDVKSVFKDDIDSTQVIYWSL